MAKKVLIVDDDPDVSYVLELRLQEFGCDLVTATNGAQGCAKAQSEIPDLIFLDVEMPGEGGLDVLKKLKTEMPESVKKIPVVMLTSHENLDKYCREAGAAAYITKPFDPSKLKELLTKYL